MAAEAEDAGDETEDTAKKFENMAATSADLRKDDQDWQPTGRNERFNLQQRLPQFVGIFQEWPLFDYDCETVQDFTRRFLAQPEAYSWCLNFSADMFCELAYEGFLSTSLEIPAAGDWKIQVLLPWNDPKRNTLDWQDVHVSRQVKKRAKKYTMTVDAAYDEVMLGCIRMHGEGWLYRGLRWLLRGLFQRGYAGRQKIKVGVHSFELWDEDGRLVAGDFGYTVGGVYTSMTGFRLPDTKGAGDVQLALTASLLRKMGCVWWDLGMVMKYKAGLGAKVVKRDAFVRRLQEDRDKPVDFHSERMPGQELLRELLDFQASARAAAATAATVTAAAGTV